MGSKVVAVIGARLNSSRLPGKQLLPLNGRALISHIADRLRTVKEIDSIVLATTADAFNQPLVDWAKAYGVEYYAHPGDVNDLMGRVDQAFTQHDGDILLYVCGDSPLVDPVLIGNILKAMKADTAAETYHVAPATSGYPFVHEGFNAYRRGFWQRMVAASENDFEREHVASVYHSLGKVTPTHVCHIVERETLAVPDIRLSVDTPSDYRFMRRLYAEWYAAHPADSLVDLEWVVAQISARPDLRQINANVRQKTVRDKSAKVQIYTEAGPGIGLGHVGRSLVAAAALQDVLSAGVSFQIRGEAFAMDDLALIPHRFVDAFEPPAEGTDLVIVDVKKPGSFDWEMASRHGAVPVAGIDVVPPGVSGHRYGWFPSVGPAPDGQGAEVRSGWDCLLARKPDLKRAGGNSKMRLIVLTGGSDAAGLAANLPDMLLQQLSSSIEIDWVSGPFATTPVSAAALSSPHFRLLRGVTDLPQILPNYDMALCVFGVSLFECLSADLPVVTFDAIGAATPQEWARLHDVLQDYAAPSLEQAVAQLVLHCSDKAETPDFTAIGSRVRSGPVNFAKAMADFMAAASGKEIPA